MARPSFLGSGLILCVGLALAGATYADPPSGVKGPKNQAHEGAGGSGHRSQADKGGGAEAAIRIAPEARQAIEGYYRERPNCPPGLAKKRNGCLPPGQAKKHYSIGAVLPRSYWDGHLPPDLLRRLPPPPAGYIYRHVDSDILLVAEATHRVVDAVVAIDAAANALKR